MKYGIVTSVWGDEYLYFYLNYILPATLKNINSDTIIGLSIVANEFDKINKLLNEQYKDYFNQIFIIPNDIPYFTQYSLAAQLDRNCISALLKEKNISNFILQNPDLYISKSMFDNIYNTNKKVIVLPGIRILKEEFLLTYGSLAHYTDEQVLDYAMSVTHPITKALGRKGGYKAYDSSWPSVLYELDLFNNRIFGVAFHLHPIYFEIRDGMDFTSDNRTLDDIFLSKLGYDTNKDFDFLNHSSQGYILEFSSWQYYANALNSRRLYTDLNDTYITYFMRNNCSPMHLQFATKCFTWSNDPKDALENSFKDNFPPCVKSG